MAENINLVGNFTDNISPKLRKLNRELSRVTKSFTKLGGRIRPVTKEMGKLAMATDRVADNLKSQRNSLTATTQAMRSYTTATRKATAQQKKLKAGRIPAPPRGARPQSRVPARGSNGAMMTGGAAFGITLGSQLGGAIQRGIMMGFDYGRTIIMGAFQKFGAMIGERIQDEMSDIQSAGGMFALDKKSDPSERLFKNFTQARNMQELLNRELAKSAAALPGATSDYVQASKQLTDTVFATFAKDKEAFAGLAVSLGGKEGGTATEDITKVLSRFTEQSVLLSQGGGKGGMPLGMLLEQLITMDQVNMDSMKRRYAQLRKNPLLANMLKDAESAINESGAGTAERFKSVMAALDNALPAEVVNSMRRSVDGVIEATRSAFLDPEVGLLGLGRPLGSMVKSIDSFGRYIDKNGKVVQNAADAAEEQTTVFKLLRDVMAGFGLPLSEIAAILPQVFDPLEGLASGLKKLRQTAVDFAQLFDGLTNTFKAKGLDQASARAALAAFSNLMRDLGGLSELQHKLNIDQLLKKDVDFATIVPRIMQQVLDSPIAEQFGEAIGHAMGSIVATIAQIMTGVVDKAGTSKLAKGFIKAWNAAGGTQAIKTIFSKIFEVMGRLLMGAVQAFPFEAFMLGILALAPAIVAGLGAALPVVLSNMLMTSVASSGGIATAIAGGFSAILASPALLAAIIGGLAITAKATEGARKSLTDSLASSAQQRTDSVRGEDGQLRSLQGNGLAGVLDGLMGELTWVVHDFIKGFGDIFTGLYNIIVGAFSDPAMVTEGVNQIFSGLWSLFTMVGHLIIAIGYAVPGLIMGVLIAIKNLFAGIVGAIAQAGANAWASGTAAIGGAIAGLWAKITSALSNINPLNWFKGGGGGGTPTESRGGGRASSSFRGSSAPMSLGAALSSEMKNKPKGSHLVIANSSETVVPAANGYMASGTGAGGSVSLSGVTINVSGVQDPKAIANVVAEEILYAVQKNTYKEIYTT